MLIWINQGGETQVTKFPYVTEYKLFERVDVREAEELLREYNDFYIYNQSQYNDIFRKLDAKDTNESETGEEDDERLAQLRALRAEQNAKAATDHFAALFGSKDFAESTLVGLKFSWYDLQQLLLEEFRTKTLASQSIMNHVAPRLRRIASALLFAEYMIAKLGKMYKQPSSNKQQDIEKADIHNQRMEVAVTGVKSFFVDLLELLAKDDNAVLPEFGKSRNALAKLKTPEAIIEFCTKSLIW